MASTAPRSRLLALSIAGGLALTLGLLNGPTAVADTPPNTAASQPKVLIFGDSYTQGVGAVPQTAGYAYQVGPDLDWDVTVDGKGGSGYENPTNYGAGIYAQRMWAHSKQHFDLVIIQGSSNDARYCSPTDCKAIAGDVNMAIRTAKRIWPDAKIIMVGPTSPYGGTYPLVTAKLQQYASTYGLQLIDPTAEAWFIKGDGATYANPADGHPNNAGHTVIAQRLAQDLQTVRGLR